jgi:tetratricopeptide (TPR) repeat protein
MPTDDIGRNDPCPCGSGAKYKHCCLRKEKEHQPESSSESTSDTSDDAWRRQLATRVDQIDNTFDTTGWQGRTARRTARAAYEAWQLIDEHLPDEVTHIDELEDRLDPSMAPVAPWLQQGIDAWIEAADDDPELADHGAAFVADILERFPDESRNYRRGLEADRAQLLARAERWDEAEPIFEHLIDERPDSPQGYADMADALLEKEPAEPERAVQVLERALERPVDNPKGWKLELRLEDARKELRWATSDDSGRKTGQTSADQ